MTTRETFVIYKRAAAIVADLDAFTAADWAALPDETSVFPYITVRDRLVTALRKAGAAGRSDLRKRAK